MIDSFMWFIVGAFVMRALQWIMAVRPNYYVWKHTEYTILQLLTDLYVQQLTANQILKLAYEEADKLEEYDKVKSAIEQKYNGLINNSLNNMKNNLPYRVKYNDIKEAAMHYIVQAKENKDVQQKE